MRHGRATRWLTSVYLLSACSSGASEPSGDRIAQRWTPPGIATAAYEATPTFAPDGSAMIYMVANPQFSAYRLAQTRCIDGRWSAPEPLPFAAGGASLDADPFWARDGRHLYFISTRHDPKNEDFDIYRVTRDEAGRWSVPERLPAPVNSPASELLPRIDGEGRLYFGSSRPGGQGQGDIYVATPAANGGWTVANVGAPVSTAAFEYEAEISRDGRTMVVVADRGDRSHLYLFRQRDGRWQEEGRVPALDSEFQVGPLLSPKGDRLIFAQRDGARSGEMFLVDLVAKPDPSWPPACVSRRAP